MFDILAGATLGVFLVLQHRRLKKVERELKWAQGLAHEHHRDGRIVEQ